MNEEYITTIEAIVYGQMFIEAIDKMRGQSHFKQQLKNKANLFNKEVEKFMNATYGGGSTDNNIIDLCEHLETVVRNEINEKVVIE